MNKNLLWTIVGVLGTIFISIATLYTSTIDALQDTDQQQNNRLTVLESDQITRGQMLKRENRITIIEKDIEALEGK